MRNRLHRDVVPANGTVDSLSPSRWAPDTIIIYSMSRQFTLRSLVLVLVMWTSACGAEPTATPPQGAGIDRETFIATYVDLRTAVIRSESPELSDQDRARVLSDHGVSEDDLMEFAEVHGTDVDFMRHVWDEVEARLDAVRLVPSTEERR